jgi:hypothetical protein
MIAMNTKKCFGPCGKVLPLTDFHIRPNGKPIGRCKVCNNLYQREYRKKGRKEYVCSHHNTSYTEMRHPDPMVMEANVQGLIKKYADEERKIEQAGLGFIPKAGVCDEILKGI